MAPARMVDFIEQHIVDCDICQADSDIHNELEKITEIVLPESKIPKAVRLAKEKENIAHEKELEQTAAEETTPGDDESGDPENRISEEEPDDEI